ncbi:copper oxidase [Cryobacterium zongtaii]|uniref:Copper oxidase n=1 Tax=Cryobacterium zongtaii TaxID=1259217 RepID=A0A2S3ZCA5_9MICO|nr:multicopper oxidase family protein [Cryobacterium zongtaii]POH63870.1 copper oxidase [Cryobacterium zongtaii]
MRAPPAAPRNQEPPALARPVSRRTVLALGGLGVIAVAGGAAALWATWPSGTAGFVGGDDLHQPDELTSSGGLLDVTLSATPATTVIGGRSARVLGYNGGLPGPTLRLVPGDRLRVTLVNGLAGPTNLHVHGLHVSPEGNGDNMAVMVKTGESFHYEYRLPADHPPGVYWYHPHHHGTVADQVFGGLYGTIVIDDPVPIESSRERVLVISDVTLDGVGAVADASAADRMQGREGELVLVNGQLAPVLALRPGERERWRIVNACVSRYLRLRLDGQRLQLLGIDSGRLERPAEVDEILLAPGNRADILVTALEGGTELRTLAYDRGTATSGGMMGGSGQAATGTEVALATVTVTGDPVAAPGAVPRQPAPLDLRGATVTARRELSFDMGMGMGGGSMMTFTINGQEFDPERLDTTVLAGSVEEWTLRNTSEMDHPVHLHVWPMQIVDRGGTAEAAVVWRDVVNVPARGQTTVRISFADFAGRAVYHCHILDHEDAGMMGTILVR